MSDIEELAHLLDLPSGDLDWGVDGGEPFCFLEYEQSGEMSAVAAAALEAGAALGGLPGGEDEQQPQQQQGEGAEASSRTRPRL
jgi:hypothetical protein